MAYLVDTGQSPVIHFDDFEFTIIHDKAWFTLLQTRPAVGGAELERVIVGRAVAQLDLAFGMIDRLTAQTGRGPMTRKFAS